MKDVIVILTDINGSCDTTHLFVSNNSLRAKTGHTVGVELTKTAVTSTLMKGRRYYREKKEEGGLKK